MHVRMAQREWISRQARQARQRPAESLGERLSATGEPYRNVPQRTITTDCARIASNHGKSWRIAFATDACASNAVHAPTLGLKSELRARQELRSRGSQR